LDTKNTCKEKGDSSASACVKDGGMGGIVVASTGRERVAVRNGSDGVFTRKGNAKRRKNWDG
jgi:hypothetical protein